MKVHSVFFLCLSQHNLLFENCYWKQNVLVEQTSSFPMYPNIKWTFTIPQNIYIYYSFIFILFLTHSYHKASHDLKIAHKVYELHSKFFLLWYLSFLLLIFYLKTNRPLCLKSSLVFHGRKINVKAINCDYLYAYIKTATYMYTFYMLHSTHYLK